MANWPSTILSSWYSLLATWRQTGGQAGLDAFTDYLTGGTNQLIRAFVPGTTGQGHQTATANILRRLFMPQNAVPLPGFGYTGQVDVYCNGDANLQARFRALLPELTGGGPVYGFYGGTLRTLTFDAAHAPDPVVNIGVTGGADDDDIHYAAALNVNYFLRLQPYRWPGEQQIQFLSANWPYVDLGLQRVLGFGTLVERAYTQPLPPITWNQYAANQRAMIVQWVLQQATAHRFDFMPVYSVRFPSRCEMGTPAQDRIVEICAGAMAAQDAAGGAAQPALIVNIDVFEENYEFSLERVADILEGGPTNHEQNFDIQPQADQHYQARRNYLQNLNPGGTRFASFIYNDASEDNLELLQDQVAGWLTGHDDRVLWVQLGRAGATASLLPPPVFDQAFAGGTLPGVFEGQNTANLMLNVGRPYFHVNRPQSNGIQYPTALLGLDGQGTQPRRFQTAADQIHVPLGQWPVTANDNPAEQIGAFIQALRAEAGNGPLTNYLAAIRNYYGNQLNDKLGLVLTFYNYLIRGRAAQLLALTAADGGDTLAGIYENFSTATEPVMFAAQLDPAGQISKFVVDMQSGFNGPFSLTGVETTRDPAAPADITKVTVTGTTLLFGVPNKVNAVFTAPEGIVELNCQFIGALSWSPVPWMGFTDPFVGFDVSDADLPAYGTLGGTLKGPDITFEVQLPPSDDKLCFIGVFINPPSIASFYAMVGGINLVATLPPPLNVLAALTLKDVRFVYDTKALTVATFAFDLGWDAGEGEGLPLLPGLTLDNIAVGLTVTQPGVAASLSAKLASTFTIGTGQDAGVIAIGATVPDMTFEGQLTSGVIKLQDLLNMFLPGYELIPPSAPTITQFSFSCAQKTQSYSIACQLGFDWTISLLGTPVMTLEEVGLSANGDADGSTGRLSASLTLLPQDPLNNLTLLLAAEYLGSGKGWSFSGEQDPGKQQVLSLNNLIKTYLGPDWALPGGDYGINGISASTTPTGATQTYKFAGKTAEPWVVPFLPGSMTITAAMDLGYAPPVATPEAAPVLSGKLSAVIDWYSVEIALAWLFGEDGAYTYTMDWGMFHGEIAKNDQDQWVATGSLQNQTLGSIVEQFVSFATGSPFGLTSPWDLLNSVPLGMFEVTFNFTTNNMGLNVAIGPIDLGFATIDSIGVVYDPSGTDRKVMIKVVGSFAWTDDSDMSWDATKPETAPAPPGGGNKYIDLRLLALGQHVGLVGAPAMQNVSDAIKALRNLGPDDAPVDGPNTQVYFEPSVAWLVGMDFGLMRVDDDGGDGGGSGETGNAVALLGEDKATYTLQLSIVFDDPLLYGLRIELDGPAAKVLSGLAFEILYKRISDTVGVYQAELSLPTAMRTIDVGAYTLTFPTFSLAVYTNGDFLADIGFPHNLDFSRSFKVQAIIPPGIPVLGAAGIYFGKLSSATTNKVPAASNGQFNPVIVFGFGAQVGFGKEVNYGLLSAGFSLTVVGIIEGVIAKWCPNQPNPSGGDKLALQSSYYFWLQGSFGILGRLYGSVDFAVVKASVDITISVMAQITYESYHDIPISVIASVDVRASLEINLGLFSITLHFSFSMTIKETFTIHNPQQPNDAPWQVTSTQMLLRTDRLHRRLRARMADPAPITTIAWDNLAPAATPANLTAWLAPAITVSGEGATTAAGQKTAYVALVAIESVDPSAAPVPGAADTAFELLAKQILRWLIAGIQPPPPPPPPPPPFSAAEVDALFVSDDNLLALSNYLADPSNPVPIPVSAIEDFMHRQFKLNIGVAGTGKVNATPFPMPPELTLSVPAYNGAPAANYSFADFNSTSPTYLTDLRAYFDALAVIVQPKAPTPMLLAEQDSGMSIGSFLFADQFRLIARQMIESCRTALRDFTYPVVAGQAAADILIWVNTTGGLAIPYTGAELFAANPAALLSSGAQLTIAGATLSAPAGATFTSLAGGFGQGLTPAALATANADADQLLAAGATIAYPSKPDYVVQPRDTLNIVATHFGVSLADLLANSAVLAQIGLIVPLAALIVPPVSYAATASDTLTTVSQRFGVTIESLATPANLAIAGLFAAGGKPLGIPHLPQFQVGALIEEVQSTGQIAQISGMVGRYSLHGLRLPTNGVTPNQPNCCSPTASDCPIYALSGQQFVIPPLTATAFGFTLTKPGTLDWIVLPNGNELDFTMPAVQIAQTQALQAFLGGANYAFEPPGAVVRAEAAYGDSMTSWSVGVPTGWASAGTIALPYGAPPAGQTELRLWPLPDALVDLYDSTRDAPPRAAPVLRVYDEASGTTAEQDVGAYAWAMQVSVTAKRRPASASPAGLCTYDFVGVDESEITLLERFLSWTSGSSAGVLGFDLLYPGQAAAGASGLQSNDPAAVTWGIIQVNLSTVTNPPTGGAVAEAEIEAAAPGACFNTAYDFIKLLWECSITRSGGFYLYYCNGVTGDGLPDSVFNDKGEATLSLVLRLTAPAGAADQNLLPGFVNALVTGAPFETGNASVVVRAAPLPIQVTATATDSLVSLGLGSYTDPIVIAEDNAGVALATGAVLTITRGLYIVGPLGTQPGGVAATIASWFGTQVPALQAANPQVTNWTQPLAPGVALYLPAISLTVGTGSAGTTLAAIGAYYGCGVDGLAADNQTRPGIFAGASLTLSGGPTTRVANTPAGSVTIAATRDAPAAVPAPTDPSFAQLYLQSNFTLLGYALGGNAWFNPSLPGLPLGSGDTPQDSALAADRRRRPQAVGDDPLNYSRVVPVSRYAVATSSLGSAAGPDPAASPYRGLGGIAQLDLYWLDSFGNRIVGGLGETPSGAPTTAPALPLLYTDAIVALALWPGVSSAYLVIGDPGSAAINLVLSFDPTTYADPTPKWADRAAQALQTYVTLYYQLAADFDVALETTLLTSGTIGFTTAQTDALQNWLFGANGVYAFLSAQAGGGGGTAPADLTLSFPLAPAAINPGELFELTTSIVFSRPSALVGSGFVDAAGVASGRTIVAPAYGQDPAAAGDRTLAAFAAAFEHALGTPGQIVVKLANGIDRREAVEAVRPLWLLRLAPGPGLPPGNSGAGYQIDNPGAPMIYAPRPLFNALQPAAAVPIYPYQTGVGIDFTTPSQILNLGSVDTDLWLGQMLAAVDLVLGPDLAASAALVDLRTSSKNLERLLAAKELLADELCDLLIPVFVGPPPSDAGTAAAIEALRQQLLQTLSSFYDVSAAVQFSADVRADMNDPDFTSAPPQLYGKLVPATVGGPSDPGVSLTSAKLPLATTPPGQPAELTFLARSRNGRDASGALEKSATLNLDYGGLQIEHQIGPLPNIEGYLASTWLSFVLPPPAGDVAWPLASALGSFEIPLVLRSFPTPPSMVNQAGKQPPDPTPGQITLAEAVLWNYLFVYSQNFHYPQDRVDFVSTFNIGVSVNTFDTEAEGGITNALGEFVTVYPSVATDIAQIVALVGNSTVDPVMLDKARIALLSFVQLVERAANALVAPTLMADAMLGAGTGQAPYPFSVSEDSIDKTNPGGKPVEALLITLTGLPPAGIGTPSIDIAGYTAQRTATETGFTFTYIDANNDYLPASVGQTIPQRTITLPGLNILAAQNASTSASILRNQNLVEGKVTAEPFLYQTSPISFANPLRPTFVVLEEIDISAIPTGNPVKRPLAVQLGGLFTALFAEAPAGQQEVQLTVSYTVSVNPAVPPVALPVAFLPPIAFLPDVAPNAEQSTAEGDPISQAALVEKIDAAIMAWYQTNAPQPNGTLCFDLQVMTRQSTGGGVSAPPTPLLELADLVLNYADWGDPPTA